MITIGGTERFILNLDSNKTGKHELNVSSTNKKGRYAPFNVVSVSSVAIKCDTVGRSTLSVLCDLNGVKKNELIVLENSNGERCTIIVTPNAEESGEKRYEFRIAQCREDVNTFTVKLISKVDGKPCGWKCTYDGKPFNYVVSPMMGSGVITVSINLKTRVTMDTASIIEFTQEASGKKVTITLSHKSDGTTNVLRIE